MSGLNRNDIIRMAREAGFYGSEILGDHEYDVVGLVSDLERFAELIAAAEREACAKVCDRGDPMFKPALTQSNCADLIRARGYV